MQVQGQKKPARWLVTVCPILPVLCLPLKVNKRGVPTGSNLVRPRICCCFLPITMDDVFRTPLVIRGTGINLRMIVFLGPLSDGSAYLINRVSYSLHLQLGLNRKPGWIAAKNASIKLIISVIIYLFLVSSCVTSEAEVAYAPATVSMGPGKVRVGPKRIGVQ